MTDEELVLPAERDDAEGGLRAVVVRRDARIAKKMPQRLPGLQSVAHRDGHVALGRSHVAAPGF
jgi:hypothetical protein